MPIPELFTEGLATMPRSHVEQRVDACAIRQGGCADFPGSDAALQAG
jgi:hypothetical protein